MAEKRPDALRIEKKGGYTGGRLASEVGPPPATPSGSPPPAGAADARKKK